jgi:DNA (cytosine-5)-methyltransferase 1
MKEKLKVLDLFSGIGGFSLGLERAGMKTVAFCEIDPFCQKVLKKHWPEVLKFKDIKDLSPKEKDYDVICGGFPCQNISVGGNQKGITGKESSLWKEYWRIINEVRPRYAIIENVERLRKNGLGVVLNDLSKIGYDAEWHCITAEAVGLPHQRDRMWIISYPRGERQHERVGEKRQIQADKKRKSQKTHTKGERCQLEPGEICTLLSRGSIDDIKNAYASKRADLSSVRRVTNGIPKGLHEAERKRRIKALGNSVVPQIPELIGRMILEYVAQENTRNEKELEK